MDTNFRINLFNNWKIQSSKEIEYMGAELSTVLNSTNEWFSAIVPSTVLATLVANKVYTDPYFGKNMENIPTEQFKVPWWYRVEFDLSPKQADKTVHLHFDGINYKANVWLNGTLIANSDQINGTFRRTNFNISEQVNPGKNILAIEVIPPKPGDFSIGFVDWNIAPPDNNMGIFRDVSLHFSNGISIDKPFVETKLDLKTLKSADLKISAELTNHSNKKISGLLKCSFGTTFIEKYVSVSQNSTLTERFSVKEFPKLKISEPKLWWPNTMGEPVLHDLNLSFEIDNVISDSKNLSFGIREVEDYINNDGHRGFKINGKEVLIKGAGWTDDLLLQDTHESLENQIAYVKHMNLNCIRLEGFWGKDHKLYDLCDQNGILMMVGWSCHWEHEQYLGKPIDPQYGGVIGTDEIELIAQSWEDQIIWLRQHPAIFVWTVGSDMVPHPELEKKYIESFNKYDTSRPYLNSTGGVGSEQGIITETEIVSEISGSSCVKMLGPYAYTPPVYWFTNQNLGGAYGFNTETCPGATVPPLASIKKMIPTESLWPIDEVWEYHCGSYVFGTLDRYKEAINKRYGESSNIEDFAFKSQVLNYELMRPMFEAFVAHKPKSTGVIHWMLNSAWPEMYWQLYDSYLQPNGAFYAVRNACKTIHAIYRYGKSDIFLANEDINGVSGLKVKIRIYDINSQ
ncbi:MAG: glycoside hydrolase family 2, partial [Bacteroidetes bacterium]